MICSVLSVGAIRGADFHMDRDARMYDHDDRPRYGDRPPLLPAGHRSHSPEYRPPPQRSQRGGRSGPLGPGRDLGGPRGYDNTGLGRTGDYDINLLMNLSKMLS